MKPELLAPAGNLEKLKWAVAYGADAVYFGTEFGSLRSFAGNFTLEDAAEGLEFLHSRGKKGYVALNIYPFSDEYEKITAIAGALDEVGADAFIVSDIGVLAELKKLNLKAKLHISTQANTMSYQSELARHTLTEVVSINREAIMEKVHQKCNKKAKEYGIEVIDVRIKRADLPEEVAHSVYARMRAERERIAKKYRSEGEEESVKIKATTDKERTIMLAESYRQAEKLKGEGDAGAIKIYAEAFEKDPEFYSFLRTLEAYQKALRRDTTVVLPSNSEFFEYLSP